ncbi:MAG: ATP-binding protein [Vulcanimicrobiota bacterium]
MKILIRNLVGNAVEALPPEAGKVTLSVGVLSGEKPRAYLEVSDTGKGMTQEQKSRMFEPFYSTKCLGRGMGLSEALGIVRRHLGEIRVLSEAGRGTTVRVVLPMDL